MSVAIRPRLAPFGWSIALHVAIAGLLVVKFVLPEEEMPPQGLQIEAVIVNQAVIQAAASLRREDRRKQEQEEVEQRKEQERVAQVENDKRAKEQRRLEAEQAEQQKADQEKARAAADAQRKAEDDARRKAAADQKRKAEEARLRAERELELRARLAEEKERTGAAFQGLKAQYIAAIQAHVERRWFRPPGTPAGATCIAVVTQIPGGEVVDVRFERCGGGEAFRYSIENAIKNASPLPPPPQPALFEREVHLGFHSED